MEQNTCVVKGVALRSRGIHHKKKRRLVFRSEKIAKVKHIA